MKSNVILFNLISNIKQYSEKYKYIMYIVCFALIFQYLLGSTYININFSKYYNIDIELKFVKRVIQFVALYFAFSNILFFITNKKILCFICLSFIIGGLVKLFSGNSIILLYIVISLAISRLNYKYVLYVFIAATFSVILITFSLFFLDMLDTLPLVRRGAVLRESFGFYHPNTLGSVCFFLCLTFWSISKNHSQVLLSFLLSAISLLFLTNYVDSRTSQHMLCLLLLLSIINEIAICYRYKGEKFFSNIIIKNLLVYSLPILSISTLFFTFFYNPDNVYYSTLDKLFSGRLNLSHVAFSLFELTPFGQELIMTDNDPFRMNSATAVKFNTLDIFSVFTVFNYGIVALFYFLLVFVLVSKKAIESKEYKIALSLSLISIYGLMEHIIVDIGFNIFIFMLMMNFCVFNFQCSTTCLSKNNSLLHLSSKIKYLFLSNQFSLRDKKVLIAFLFYITIIISLASYYFVDLVEFVKSVANLIDASIEFKYIWFFYVILCLVILYIFAKLLFEVIMLLILKNNKKENYINSIFGFATLFFLISISILTCYNKINLEISLRTQDIDVVKKIDSIVSKVNPNYKLYVNRLPFLYKQSNLQVQPHILSFDGIAFKNEDQIVITDPSNPHYVLINYGYKFYKISENTAIFVKGPKLINTLYNTGFKLTNYYFNKRINFDKLAMLTYLKYGYYGILIDSEKSIANNSTQEYFVKGNYKISLDITLDRDYVGEDFANFKITASDQQLTIFSTAINTNSCIGNICKLDIPLKINQNYHGVEFIIKPLNNNRMYLTNIEYSKLP